LASTQTVLGPIVFGGTAAIAEGLNISLYSNNPTRDTIQSMVTMPLSTNTPLDMIYSEFINQANNYSDNIPVQTIQTTNYSINSYGKMGY